ncbi:MAG: ABC-type uncharacterized transport system, permease component [bacterium P3]|nr:MAG: ABC-type uncharacterized transport system, permease component [bacterium P3]KWW33252.1 MAG: ABC-type uncharacterized transport system, permease component [bacterium F083]
MIIELCCASLIIGLLYSILAIGSITSFRIVGFPDMTPDGAFLIGAALSGICILSNCPWWMALLVGGIGGIFCGLITAFLYLKFHISKLLSGILNMTMLYSVSLRIMGRSNLSLQSADNTLWQLLNPTDNLYISLFLCLVIVSFIYAMYLFFLKTIIGLRLRALGDSESTFQNKGLPVSAYTYIGLSISNAFAALSGALVSQYQCFVDVGMGTGVVIISLAGIIIGETILKPDKISLLLAAAVLGMIIYEGVITFCLQLGLPATDLKISTAVMTIIFIALRQVKNKNSKEDKQIGNQSI